MTTAAPRGNKSGGDTFTELKGGDRLYNLFKKKLEKAPPANVISRKKQDMKSDLEGELDFFITIPLKGAKAGVSKTNITLHHRKSLLFVC